MGPCILSSARRMPRRHVVLEHGNFEKLVSPWLAATDSSDADLGREMLSSTAAASRADGERERPWPGIMSGYAPHPLRNPSRNLLPSC